MAAGLASCAWLLRVGQGAGGGWRYAGAMDAREELQLLVPLVGFLCTTRMPEWKELLRHGARRRDGVGKKWSWLVAAREKVRVGVKNCQVQERGTSIYRHGLGLGFFSGPIGLEWAWPKIQIGSH